MGNCFGSVPFLHTMKDRNRMEPDSENRAGTSSEGSNGPRRKGRGSPKRPAERGEAKKSTSPGDTAEDPSERSEMPPAEKKARKPNKRGKRGGKAAMNSVPTTSSASPPKKVKKEESADSKRKEPARSPPPRNASPKKTRPVGKGDAKRGAKGDAKRGGGRCSREAMPRAGTLDVEANMEVEYMEVTKTRQEPPVQGVSPPTEVKAETLPGRGDAVVVVEEKKEKEEEEDDDDDGEEDIYRTEEEITLDEKKKKMKKKGHAHQQTLQDLAGPKDNSSVEAEVNLLSYSQKEWRGNTAKSALIRQGYEEVSQSFVGLRRVRGDNYCALRATLFQVFAQSAELPSWLREDDVTLWPEQLLAEKGQIGGAEWRFPTENQEKHAPEGAIEQLKNYMGRLRTRWEEVAQASGAQERQNVCESVFRAEDEEYGLLEVLKFLMLRTATELYERMQRGDDVPVFCWLLFARDTSSSPRAFLSNHLSHVGFSGGLEQVEMFLLGYALQQTIKVYRLYKAGTEEFVTNYPDDHKEWPCVCLVTEDDRHYNVPVSEAERLQVPESPTLD
ncbi:hypothetical protein SKAU_G00380950 [Synaphobranchus kaupii]|uniref:Uncharacterized protein n=1 Tax=Synaphobranchus kaupii TaxID=118154 RepID=A0A9Q1EDM7_SYNKA|nr:hypothetical protein SKAU_G00380950 [Synaphobranchus kaupii]